MQAVEISQEILDEVRQVLDALNDPTKLNTSMWLSSCLVSKHLQDKSPQTSFQALKAIFDEILTLVEAESADYADLLRGRFWEGHNVKKMIVDERPKAWSERTFFNYQNRAIYRFAQLLWEKEQACQQVTQQVIAITKDELLTTSQLDRATLEASLPPLPESENKHNPWLRMRYLTFLGVSLCVITVALWQMRLGIAPNPSTPIATTIISSTTFLTVITPTVSSALPLTRPSTSAVGQVCGESKRITASSVSRFVRYQGVSDFTIENTQGAMLSTRIRSLAIDPRGLWIGYWATKQNAPSGVGQYNKVTWAKCNIPNNLTNKNINAIAIDKNSIVWVGTEKAGVAQFDGQQWRVYTKENGLPSNEIFGLTIDDANNIWVSTWEGVAKFDGKVWSVPYTVYNHTLFDNHVHTIAFDSAGNIWVGHIGAGRGISQFRKQDSRWVHHTKVTSGIGGDDIRDIVVRKEISGSLESIWVATADGGISKFEQGRWSVYTVKDGLPSNEVLDIAIDSFGRIWAATTSGVAYFNNSKWVTYDTINTLSIAIGPDCQNCPFNSDHVWTGTAELGLTHSRIPYPNDALDVTEVCFVSIQDERECHDLAKLEQTKDITVTYSKALAPDETFRTEITVTPLAPYQLREDRGDFLSNTDISDTNLFRAWPSMAITGITTPGQRFTFTSYDTPFIAPTLSDGKREQTFVTTWQVWMYTRYVGPKVHIVFTVQKKT